MIFEDQPHQQQCVARILDALAGVDFAAAREAKTARLRENLEKIAREDNIPNFRFCDRWGMDVLMETGTGKTFVYIKTIFELHKKFGQDKFIIVLPRTAIKLGVIQNIKLTKSYFYDRYKKHLNVIDYPADGLSPIRNDFINSRDLSVLVITNSAFNSEKNRINQATETLIKFGNTWQGMVKQSPVIIIDEPHLLKGGQTVKYLDEMTDSLRLRFGATFPREAEHQLSNQAYVLDSVSSFNQYLVKQIQVNTEFINSEQSALRIHNIRAGKQFDACYNVNEQLHKTTIRKGDDIGGKTGIAAYAGVSVVKINKDKVMLNPRATLEAGAGAYQLNDEEIRLMIRRTIALHFEKEQRYFERGVKTLSLFFIPRVDDYRGGDNPRVKSIFETEYRAKRREIYAATDNAAYQAFLDKDGIADGALRVGEGYFSGDRGRNKDDKEAAGINVILNEKERLLSFDEPLRFVFSVWALQEGWDNPNIFNICKLAGADKETSRRQQVGRGLRVAVNQNGKRLTYKQLGEKESDFYDINTLDMVVSGQEQHFIHAIQHEIMAASFALMGGDISVALLGAKGVKEREAIRLLCKLEDAGIVAYNEKTDDYDIRSPIADYLNAHREELSSFLPADRCQFILGIFNTNHDNMVKDGNKKAKMVKVRQSQWREFQQLWEAINKKARIVYRAINEQDIVGEVAAAFNRENIPPLQNRSTTDIYDPRANKIINVRETTADYETQPRYFEKRAIADYATHFAKEEKYPLPLVINLFNQLDIKKLKDNPAKSGRFIRDALKEAIHKTILREVSYQFNETSIYANELQNERGELIEEIAHTKLGRFYAPEEAKREFLYDTVVYDSKIEKDGMLNDATYINGGQIVVFAKLPKISIPTPYKTYNPDFAYLVVAADGKKLFLVVETKGYKYESDIPEEERRKIGYAKRFFEALQRELPDVDIQYKTRINRQQLSELIT